MILTRFQALCVKIVLLKMSLAHPSSCFLILNSRNLEIQIQNHFWEKQKSFVWNLNRQVKSSKKSNFTKWSLSWGKHPSANERTHVGKAQTKDSLVITTFEYFTKTKETEKWEFWVHTKAPGHWEKCIWFWEMIVSRARNERISPFAIKTNSFLCFSPQIFGLECRTKKSESFNVFSFRH